MTKYDPGVHAGGDDFMCLHRNENLLIPASWAVDALPSLGAEIRISEYPEADSDEVRASLADLYGVGTEQVYVGNGADGVLADLLVWLRPRYDAVSVLDASFKVYPLLAHRYGYRLLTVPGDTFRTGSIDADQCSGLTLIDSPNAITGARIAPEVLISLASKRNSFLIWDNVYGEFAGDAVPDPIPANVVVVRSFSKFYGLAGLRVGYCIAKSTVVDGLLAVKDAFPVSSVAQRMALAALERHGEFEAIAAQLADCRGELISALLGLGFMVDHEPSANYVLARHERVDAERLQELLTERRILVRRFVGELTGSHVRITVPPMADVRRLSEALRELLASPGASA